MNKPEPESEYLTPDEKWDIAIETAADIFAAIGLVATVVSLFLLAGYFYG